MIEKITAFKNSIKVTYESGKTRTFNGVKIAASNDLYSIEYTDGAKLPATVEIYLTLACAVVEFAADEPETTKKVKELTEKERKAAIAARDFDLLIRNALVVRARIGRPFSVSEFKKYLGIHITTDHNAKMAGMWSLSTTCKCNEFCLARINQVDAFYNDEFNDSDLICGDCFSEKQQNFMATMTTPLAYNHAFLNAVVIPPELFPLLNCLFFRIEAFGDFASVTAAVNVNNFCKVNPLTTFAAWTKNPNFIYQADKKTGRPENCRRVLSESFKDPENYYSKNGRDFTETIERRVYKSFPNTFDSVFSVYRNETTAASCGAVINCGKRHCLSCLRCYTYNASENGGKIQRVNELVK